MASTRRSGLALIAFLGVLIGGAAAAERVPAVFLGFESREITASGLDILSELVMNEIAISPGYTLVDRANLERLLEEQELGISDVADSESAIRIGGILGARKLMVGRIGILGNLYIISLNMIDVATGSVERTQTEEYVGSLEDLRKPVRIAAQRLLGIEGIEVNQGEYVNVVTDPPGINVFVNGLFEGSSPVKVRVPKPGRHTVKLHAEGYRTWTQTVSVEANATYFVNAKLLKEEKPIDPRIKALQDGRVSFIIYTTLFAAASSDALVYAFGSESPSLVRLAIGLPLVAAPLAFFGTLKATERIAINGGRALMIISSSLWGSTWGLTSSLAFAAGSETGGPVISPAFAGLSVAGGLLYGTLATVITMGNEPFPASRAWLFNLGSVLGSLLGLGVPYVLGVDIPAVTYAGMLAGSLAGSATALYLTRNMTEGRSVENLASGALLNVSPGVATLGVPVVGIEGPRPDRASAPGLSLRIPLVTVAY